ncbi:unnamed protein product [Cercopithifilaria johnstoni]|uniref:Uncharacterized protein n=1 Tax=Cercopithifilaria johnstoni TaxID=2874296 RepID=A0A8J2LWS6_9BILA|nr:unnamed protein product [Cercopithifilaria johnstoni]
MKSENRNVEKQDDTTQQSRNSSSEKAEQKKRALSNQTALSVLLNGIGKYPLYIIEKKNSLLNGVNLLLQLCKGTEQSKDLPSISSSRISSAPEQSEMSCEVSDKDTTDVKENPSFVASEMNPSTISTSMSRTTKVNEINEAVEEICPRVYYGTLTYERLNRIKKYFTKSQLFTLYESDAFEWIINNTKAIYKDPINASKKLCIAFGNRTVPIDFAIKAFQPFVENHAIRMTDMIKYCSYEGRNEITINELSQILKCLIKMNIKHALYNNSDHIAFLK